MTNRKAFQLVLKGYEGSTDKTDHLIVWVVSESQEQLTEALKEVSHLVTKAEKLPSVFCDLYGIDIDLTEGQLPVQADKLQKLVDHLTTKVLQE